MSLITGSGFYYLYSQQTLLTTEVSLLKNQINSINKENHDLHIRLSDIEENSLKNITQKATNTLYKTVGNMLNVIEQKVEEARRLNAEPEANNASATAIENSTTQE